MERGAATDRAGRHALKGDSAITTLPPAASALLVELGVAQAFRQAAILQEQGRLDEAERLYLRILGRQPDHAASLCRLGALRMQQGRLEAAVTLLRRAAHATNSADAQAGLGAVLTALGRPAEAVACFEAALAADAGQAGTHSKLADTLNRLGRPAEAVIGYEKALALAPGHVEAHNGLGNVLCALGRPEQAIDHYEQALAAGPDQAAIRNNLGIALQALGRHQDALAQYRRALALDASHVDARSNLANSLHALGRSEEAVGELERVLAINPAFAAGHCNLGTLLSALGRHGDAASHYQRALVVAPADAQAHFQLGNALRVLGRHDEAASHFERALSINPSLAQAHCNLGVTIAELVGPRTAIVHYERALAAKPDLAEAHINLADALRALERHADAIPHYQQGLALRPDVVEAHNNLATALEAVERPEEAIAHYRVALTLRPDHSAISNNLTILLQKLGRFDQALVCGTEALARDPTNAEAHSFMGLTLLALGRIEEASRAHAKAVELAPHRADFHLNFANVKKFAPGDPRLAALETLAQELAQDPEAAATADARPADNDRMALNFALGKAYRDLEQPERSLRHLGEANALKRRQISYDEAATLDLMKRIPTVFTAELMRAKQGGGDPSGLPVLIVGMPRSGTTLIEQILASHSKVHGAGELDDFRAAAARIERPNGTSFLEFVRDISDGDLRRIGATYVAALQAHAANAERVVDKMPSNFHFVGLVNLVLPNARIIHARRDPVDTCLSCFSLLFSGEQPFAYDLGELGRYYRAYEQLMAHWREVLPPGVMLEVSYEDVVDDLEAQARRIIAHCGLAWEDACLAFHETRRPVQTASATQVRQPIYRGSVGRWRSCRNLLQPLLQALERQDRGDAT